MTKRDYELIARALHATRKENVVTPDEVGVWECCVYRIAHALKQTNERFDSARFVDACSYGGKRKDD